MTIFALGAAVGIVLILSGLPPANRVSTSRRVEPYLGRPGTRTSLREKVVGVIGRLSTGDDSDLGTRLRAAGLDLDVSEFRLRQAAWVAAGTLGATVIGLALGDFSARFDPIALTVLACLGACIGFVMKDRYLSRLIRLRDERLAEELPVTLDLLTLAVMSGEPLPVSVDRVARSVGGEVGREFSAVCSDIRSGTPAIDAFGTLARRVREPAIERFANSVVTALESGSSITDVFRAQADDLRDARGRRLLELGGRREVLMLVPIVFLILPVIVIFALFPGLVSLELFVP